MAFSTPVTIRAEIFRAKDVKRNFNESNGRQRLLLGSGVAKTIPLGKHLHIVLVIARPAGPDNNSATTKFPSNTLMAYDIEITDSSARPEDKGKRLEDFGLLEGQEAIVYKGSPLPTFFLGSAEGPVNLIHGSCRKLHGKGEDCIVAADELISSAIDDLESRPSALFLTGDQVYADDVAAPLAPYITWLGIELLGWEEKIRGLGQKLTEIPPGERQTVIKEHAHFTAGNADNHLIAFGEFAAMYLLAWNRENWPATFPGPAAVASKREKRRHQEQAARLNETRRDLAAVRRVLANTPSYMIFDDHEITDDWNLTREWQDNVQKSKCGKQIVSNGLVAYWAFQGWGNNPDLFDDNFVHNIVKYLEKGGSASDTDRDEFENNLINFHNWTFSAPTNPVAVFVDSRTQRSYDSFSGPPQLVGKDGILSIARAARDGGHNKGDPLIVICPTPVLGFRLIEALQKVASYLTGIYQVDLESWYANTAGRIQFLSFLMNILQPRHCIFLSGDVHYGFTVRAAFSLWSRKRENTQNGESTIIMNMTQLTSSAIKTTSLVKIAFVSEILGRLRQMFPFKRTVRAQQYRENSSASSLNDQVWIEARAMIRPYGPAIPPLIISDNNIGIVTINGSVSRIVHKLMVRKRSEEIQIYEMIATADKRENAMEDAVRRKMQELGESAINP